MQASTPTRTRVHVTAGRTEAASSFPVIRRMEAAGGGEGRLLSTRQPHMGQTQIKDTHRLVVE